MYQHGSQKMDYVRVGVIGAGRMGANHCRIYSTLRRAKLVGVCDRDPDVGHRIAQQYQIQFYPEVDELLERVDAVSVVTPTPTHFDLVMRCLEKGVHVLVEKPITQTLDQAEILTNAAEACPVVVQVGHIERFNPVYSELKNVLEDMTVLVINFRRLSAYEGSNTDVDVVLDLMIHDLDLVLDLMGQMPFSVNAQGLTAFSGTIDHAMAHLRFESGPLLTITASRVTEQKIRSIEITAREAYLEGDLLNKNISVHRRTIGEYLNHNQRGVKYRQESIVERIHVPIFEPLFLELQHFVDCSAEGKSPMVKARDGLEALRLAATIQNAINDEQLIEINSLERSNSRQQYSVVDPVLSIA
jgi:predicted dehydrogenase